MKHRHKIAMLALAVVMLLTPAGSFAQQPKGVSPSYSGCGGVYVEPIRPDFEQLLLDLVNTERRSRGMSPLKRSFDLDAAARYHAADMVQDNYFKHDSYDRKSGNLVGACDTWDRFGSYYVDAAAMGENIAAGQVTAAEVMSAWMDSSGHRDNILSGAFREIGLGYYQGAADYGTRWVQDFASGWEVFPIVIDDDRWSTTAPQVQLYIYGEWDDMRLRNDNQAWGAWGAFQPELTWHLAPTRGHQSVFVEMRKGSQQGSSTDIIYLDYDAPSTPTPTRADLIPRIHLPLIHR